MTFEEFLEKGAEMTKWGDRHYCKEQDSMCEANKRQALVIELHWYGWVIDFPDRPDNLTITYCPWCGKKLKRE